MMRSLWAAALGLAAWLDGAADAGAGTATRPVERQGVLKDLPSPPGATVEKVKALGDNAWLDLGAPAPDPKWGHARGRSWSCRMPYAPDLGGAFLNGQGIHGFIKPDGRFQDDIFFYDLYAHRWICIYPGTDTKNFVENVKKGELAVNDDGQLVDKTGQPAPFSAIPGHSYQGHEYDRDARTYVFGGGGGVGSEQHVRDQEWLKKGRELLLAQGKTDKVAGTPYFFNTVSGKFERYPPAGAARMPHGVLFYLPSRKALWVFTGGGAGGETWLANTATRQWTKLATKGPTPPGSSDLGACYDSKRDRLYLGRGPYGPPLRPDEGHIFSYDVKTSTWSNPPNQPNAIALPSTNYGVVTYDAVADRVVVVRHWEGKGGVSAYDPETGAWETMSPPAAFLANQGCMHGFYSPEVNAHFFYLAHDSDDRGTMWAYRLKRVEGSDRRGA
jgi:hypothetical protein